MSTKALTAYLKSCHTSLSAVIYQLGLNQKLLTGDTIDDAIIGQIARLRGTTPEKLIAQASAFATA